MRQKACVTCVGWKATGVGDWGNCTIQGIEMPKYSRCSRHEGDTGGKWQETATAIIGITNDQAQRTQRVEDRVARLEEKVSGPGLRLCQECTYWIHMSKSNYGRCGAIHPVACEPIENRPGAFMASEAGTHLMTLPFFCCSYWQKEGE